MLKWKLLLNAWKSLTQTLYGPHKTGDPGYFIVEMEVEPFCLHAPLWSFQRNERVYTSKTESAFNVTLSAAAGTTLGKHWVNKLTVAGKYVNDCVHQATGCPRELVVQH